MKSRKAITTKQKGLKLSKSFVTSNTDTFYYLLYHYLSLEQTVTIVFELKSSTKNSNTFKQKYICQSIIRQSNCLFRAGNNYKVKMNQLSGMNTISVSKQTFIPIRDLTKGIILPKIQIRRKIDIHILLNEINRLLSYNNSQYIPKIIQEKTTENSDDQLPKIRLKTFQTIIEDKLYNQNETVFQDHFTIIVSCLSKYFETTLKENNCTKSIIAIGDSLQNTGINEIKDKFIHIKRDEFLQRINNELTILYQQYPDLLPSEDDYIIPGFHGKKESLLLVENQKEEMEIMKQKLNEYCFVQQNNEFSQFNEMNPMNEIQFIQPIELNELKSNNFDVNNFNIKNTQNNVSFIVSISDINKSVKEIESFRNDDFH